MNEETRLSGEKAIKKVKTMDDLFNYYYDNCLIEDEEGSKVKDSNYEFTNECKIMAKRFADYLRNILFSWIQVQGIVY